MPQIQSSVSIAANTTNANVISGSAFEFLPYDAHLEIGLVGSATGLVATVISGQDVLCQRNSLSTQNRFPVYPDDFTLEDDGLAGDRLIVEVSNTTGGALTLFYTLRITAL